MSESEHTPPPDRAIASMRGPSPKLWAARLRRFLFVGGPLVLLVILTWFLLPASKPPAEPYKSQARATHGDYDPPQAAVVPAVVQAPLQASTASTPFAQALSQVARQKEEHRPVVMRFGSTALPEYMKPKAPPQTVATSHGGITFSPAAFEGSKAVTIKDRNLVLTPGPVTCIMDTMIVTGQSEDSPFQCHLDRDVLSPTNVTLMEAGTQVIGSYKSVAGDGQDRVVAVTASAVTPNGVVVQLGGPLADQLGASGVPGSVDNHWWQRIGAAVVLSLVDNGFGLAEAALSKGGSTYLNFNTGDGVGSLGQQLLAKTVNIPPTISVNQGARVVLWVTKFIDFSDAYRLEPRG
jgi:type IV secretory pathway VirB10-like protein